MLRSKRKRRHGDFVIESLLKIMIADSPTVDHVLSV